MQTQDNENGDKRRGETLREAAHLVAGSSEKEWLRDISGVLGSCQTLDATQAFSYFWDETPNEDTFRMRDLGGITLPVELRGSKDLPGALFIESRAPASGFAWSVLVDGDGRAGRSTVEEINTAARKLGVATVTVPGTPGVMGLDPGLVERAGALVYRDEAPFKRHAWRFYKRMVGRTELRQWSAVLQVIPFAGLDRDISDGGVETPQVIYYIPVGRDGRVRPLGSEEELPMVIPDLQALSADKETMGGLLIQGHRPLHLGILFSLVCAGAPVSDGGENARLRAIENDACGPGYRLCIEDLIESLDGRGGARNFGLSHALTVCRGELGMGRENSEANSVPDVPEEES